MISEPALVAVRRQVPTVEAALAALDALEDQLKAAKTYEDLARTIEVARALRTLYDDVLAVKVRAEDVVLTGTRQIGRELRKVRKGHKWQPRQFAGDGTLIQGRAETGIPASTRARFIRLAEVPDAALRETVTQLRADDRDATPTAVLDAIRQDGKRDHRAEREQALADRIQALPTKRYGVILADPPWSFEPWSRETGLDRAADNHYPTQPLEVIKTLDVASIAAGDCTLFLWSTAPMLLQAAAVMGAWGFAYKTHAIWNKDRPGTGYWFRNKHELLLVGTRGQAVAPAMGTQPVSVLDAPVGAHSAKPEVFLDLIERWYPTVPKIELNRRGRPRAGWDAWGPEAVQELAEPRSRPRSGGPHCLPHVQQRNWR